MECDGILFDLDGTLWDSVDGILKTWNQVIENHNWFRPAITRQEQESVMGMQMDEIARKLFPGYPFPQQMEYMDECMELENAYLRVHGGILYPEVEETLKALQEKHKLCIVSNCQKGYIEAFLAAHHLESYFCDHLSFGDTGRTKGENNREIIARNGFRQPVYVGDTQGDYDASRKAGVGFIHAAYGFGIVPEAQYKIQAFSELVTKRVAETYFRGLI